MSQENPYTSPNDRHLLDDAEKIARERCADTPAHGASAAPTMDSRAGIAAIYARVVLELRNTHFPQAGTSPDALKKRLG